MTKYALIDSQVKAAKPKDKDYSLPDGFGLSLVVSKAGGKAWRLKYRLDHKEQLFTIGKYPRVSVSAAREAAVAARSLIAQGIHPLAHKREAAQASLSNTANSFGAVARDWMNANKSHWSASYLQQVQSCMERYVFANKVLSNKNIRDVKPQDIRELCLLIANRVKLKPGERKAGSITTAILLRQFCGGVCRYAIGHGKADIDPTYALRNLPELKRPDVKHNRSLEKEEITALLTAMSQYGGSRMTIIGLELLLLTFVRTGELRKAPWSEFNISDAMWRIPAARMKKKRLHLVPLSSQALALLKELREINGSEDWLFPNQRSINPHMSATTFNRAIERMGFNGKDSTESFAAHGFTAHGFRGTASTQLNEDQYLREAIELQLAHVYGSQSKLTYDHAKHLPVRTSFMQDWADYIDTLRPATKPLP